MGRWFESLLWQARWAMLIPVLGLLVGGVYFAALTGLEVIAALRGANPSIILPKIINAVDLALLAAVLIIFALGLYELFIRKIEPPNNQLTSVLVVESLDDLKNKLGQVILMIMIVKFFERAQDFKPTAALDYLLFAGGVALLAAALWMVRGKS
nr:YqhA family protein [uncultured Meiothermus sp.]